MGRRGPPRKPDEVKELEGNPGNKALNHDAPEYFEQDANLETPVDLGEAGRKEWARCAPGLVQFGVLRQMDLMVFHKYCKVHDDLDYWERQQDTIRKEPAMIDTLIKIQKTVVTLRTQHRHYQQELGITPASRSSIKAKHPKGKRAGQQAPGAGVNIPTGGNVTRFFKKGTA